MKKSILKGCIASLFMLSLLSLSSFANAAQHPAYLHALDNLRAARWMINHKPGNWARSVDEDQAVIEIDAAINEIKKAAIDDGKDLMYHPKVEEHGEHGARLHAAVDYLKQARDNIAKDEDNKFAEGLQDRAYMHIDAAIKATKHAIHD